MAPSSATTQKMQRLPLGESAGPKQDALAWKHPFPKPPLPDARYVGIGDGECMAVGASYCCPRDCSQVQPQRRVQSRSGVLGGAYEGDEIVVSVHRVVAGAALVQRGCLRAQLLVFGRELRTLIANVDHHLLG